MFTFEVEERLAFGFIVVGRERNMMGKGILDRVVCLGGARGLSMCGDGRENVLFLYDYDDSTIKNQTLV